MFDAAPIKVSVVIPVYNEQESLPELIRRTTTACEHGQSVGDFIDR